MADNDVQRLLVRLEARIDRYEQNLAKANATTEKRASAIERRFDQSVRKLDEAGRRMGQAYDPLMTAANKAERQIAASSGRIKSALLSSASGIATGFVAGFSANKVKDYADGYTRYTNQLKIAGLEGQNLAGVQNELYAIAQKYGVPLEQIGTLYSKGAQAGKELGASQAQLVKFSNGVGASLKVQGGSAEQSSGALLQLSQILGSTVVHAEEFNSVNEGARPILQAVANGSARWGGSIAKLRQDVLAGKVSNKEFFDAALIGFQETERVAAKATLTIGASLTILNNALGKYIGESDESLSATARLGQGIAGVANNLDVIVPALAVLGVAYASGAIASRALTDSSIASAKAQAELAVAVLSGNAVMLDSARAAALKAEATLQGSRAEVSAIQANITALREEATQYQANIVLANEQRAAARAAQAQAASNAAAGFGNVRVGAGDVSGALSRASTQAAEAQAGKAALASRREMTRVTKELEIAEAALVGASARATAAETARTAAMGAATLAARAGALATKLFTGALTLIGGSVVGGAVVLAITAIVGAIILHNRHVKQAAADQAALRQNAVDLNERLKETAKFGTAAAQGIKGLAGQASTATPKITAFAGAVGQLADELHRAAVEQRAAQIASLEVNKSNAQQALDKATARRAEEVRTAPPPPPTPHPPPATGAGASVGLTVEGAMSGSQAAQDVAEARRQLLSADAEIKRLKSLNLEAFVPATARTAGHDLPAELSGLQLQLKSAQAAHNGAAIRELQAQITANKLTTKYMQQGLSYEVASGQAQREAGEIKSAADAYAAKQATKVADAADLKVDRADHQHDLRFSRDLAQAQDQQLAAQAEASQATEDRLKVELSRIEAARVARNAELAEQAKSDANPSGYSEAEIAQLTKISDDTAATEKATANRNSQQAVADQTLDLASSGREATLRLLQAQSGLAQTAAERRAIELRILDIQQEEEKARLDAVVASKTATEAEKELARRQLASLPAVNAASREAAVRSTSGPLETYRRDLSAPKTDDDQALAVGALQDFRSGLIDAALRTHNFAAVLSDVGQRVAEEVLGRAIDEALIEPMAAGVEKLFTTVFSSGADTAAAAAATTKASADSAGTVAAAARASADTTAAVTITALTSAAAVASTALASLAAAATAAATTETTSSFASFFGLRNGGPIRGFAGGGGLGGGPGGGMIRGPGGPRDDAILAQLASGQFLKVSNGEFVVNAAATAKNRAVLEAMNSGRVVGYAAGGHIGGSISSSIRAVNSMAPHSVGGSPVVQQFFPSFDGAVVTEDLMRDFRNYADGVGQQATAHGGQLGAAMALNKAQQSAAMRLGRGR